MHCPKLVAASILLMGCSTPQEREREALMEQIERQVQLPEGARPMGEYARYYAHTGNDEITAIYLIPFDWELRPGESCEEFLDDFTTRNVPCPTMKPAWAMPAGERRWVGNERDLPFISDGGCAQVNVTYDRAKSAVTSVECNGVA